MADAAGAAALLVETWRRGEQIGALPPDLRPATMDEGYDIQDAFVARCGESVAGWKLGLGSHAQKRTLGVGRSVAGRIFAARIHPPGAVIRLPSRAPVTVEFEIAFRLSRDVTGATAPADPRAVIGATLVTFEFVRSRYMNRRAVGWPSFAADNAGFEVLVAGDAIGLDEIGAVADSVAVSVDGVERARAAMGEDATDPFAALADLITIAGERGVTLPAGSLVTTGTATVPFDVTAPAEVAATFRGRRMACRLEAAHD